MDIPIDQFKEIIADAVLRPLLLYCAEQTKFVMQYALENNAAEISTSSLQECVTYDYDAKTKSATIYIDFETCQNLYEEMPDYEGGKVVEWGRFINVFGEQAGSSYWDGEIVAFKMADWLENGAWGNKGNNPIIPTHWFTQVVVKEVKKNLDYWATQYLTQRGIRFSRRINTKGA